MNIYNTVFPSNAIEIISIYSLQAGDFFLANDSELTLCIMSSFAGHKMLARYRSPRKDVILKSMKGYNLSRITRENCTVSSIHEHSETANLCQNS